MAKHGAGVDSVDLASATRHGIAVMVAGGANADAVAEHALAMMLSLVRELPQFDRSTRLGAWRNLDYLVRDFRVRTVGIVGFGQIGERTARLAQACGAQVVIHSRSKITPPAGMAFEPDLGSLLECADIVSLHCPLTARTRGMMGAAQFARMKPGSLLINTARGPVIDEPALVEALKNGPLAGAGLDTFALRRGGWCTDGRRPCKLTHTLPCSTPTHCDWALWSAPPDCPHVLTRRNASLSDKQDQSKKKR